MFLKLFSTIFLLLSLPESKAVILDCDFYETVDVSHLKLENDSYKYKDILIPANLTGEYNFWELWDGTLKPVKTHLRACVCKLKPCVRICCPRKDMMANGECDDDLKEKIFSDNPYLNVTLENGDITTQYLRTEMIVLREQLQVCDQMISLNGDEYILFENGTVFLRHDNLFLIQQSYCLYPYQRFSDFPNSIQIVRHNCTTEWFPATFEFLVISMVCFILTIAVYLYVQQLRNDIGKCLICSLLSLFTVYIITILDHFDLLYGFCSTAGYISYFLNGSYNLWLSVISYNLWKRFTSLCSEESPNRFLRYGSFVWLTALIPTGVIYWLNIIWAKDPEAWKWVPLVGFTGCSVDIQKKSAWIYYFGPSLILTIFNAVMFILTAIHILKVKGQLKRLTRRQKRTTTCLNFDTQKYLQFLRLFVIMGVAWILDFVYFFVDIIDFWKPIVFVVHYIHIGFGIIIFILLILKRSTFRMLMDK